MIEISRLTSRIDSVADAIQGRWDRHAEKDVVWALCGRIVLVDGKYEKFPYNVVAWHHVGSLHIGILGSESVSGESSSEVTSDVAKVLEVARRIRVDLSNNSDATVFDGSSDVMNVQVSGTLADENVAGSARWNSHVTDIDSNPHNVTADQVGAYTKDVTDQKIASAVSGVGKFLGILMVDEIEALTDLHVGDYVDVADSGVLNEGTLPVERGDCVVWDGEKWMKRLNDGKGLVVDGGEVTFG